MLDYMYFGLYRQSDGFHLVGFLYLDSNPMAKAEKCFFTPHFFDRYRERTGLPADMSKMDVMKDWIMKNIHLNSDAQGSEKYSDNGAESDVSIPVPQCLRYGFVKLAMVVSGDEDPT